MKTAIFYRPNGVIQQVCTGPDDTLWPQMLGLAMLELEGSPDVTGKHVVEGEDGPELADGILDTRTLAEAQAARRTYINQEWARADSGSFTYAGKEIACDQQSRGHIESMNGHITLFGAFPAGWPGQWKARDNTFATIADADAWKAFYGAMIAQGLQHFAKAQTLKAQIDAATSIAAVDAITW
jgi:hypothetical protein